MQIYKFGGSSLSSPEGLRHVARLIGEHLGSEDLVVISALGKTTNHLEKMAKKAYKSNAIPEKDLLACAHFHRSFVPDTYKADFETLFDQFVSLFEAALPCSDFGKLYDLVVSHGEIFSSTILHWVLQEENILSTWIDSRKVILTNSYHQSAKVCWKETHRACQKLQKNSHTLGIAQGFIGATPEGEITTLGREGSDYSAAIFACCMQAKEVTIWKDVTGFYQSDPRKYSTAKQFDNLSYQDAIELAYYGASVVHPKTIQPLKEHGIPLYVRSYVEPEAAGTWIGKHAETSPNYSAMIVKDQLFLLTLKTKNLQFILEKELAGIFDLCHREHISVVLFQNSAISCSLVVVQDDIRIPLLISLLQEKYIVTYNTDVVLHTIRNYTEEIEQHWRQSERIILEERNQTTWQFLLHRG